MTIIDDKVDGWSASDAVRAAEVAVVGAAIMSRNAAEDAAEVVRPADFAQPYCALIFEAVLDLIDDGKPIDPTAVHAELERRGIINRVGGGVKLADLMECAAIGSVTHHARAVAADATRRRLHQAGATILHLASNPGFDADLGVDLVRKTLDEATANVIGDEPPRAGDLMVEVLEDLERPLAVEDLPVPPYRDLEMLIPGFRAGQMIVIGARPGIGKTVMGLDIARAAAVRLGMPTLVFNLEMSNREVMYRLLAAEASVSLDHIQRHQLDGEDWSRVARVQDRVNAAPLILDDTPACTLARVRTRLRTMARREPARLVVIDYLGLMETGRAESHERGVAELARGLKLLAKEFDTPIVVLAQLNRAVEHRADKKPMLADLRESGAIEAHADIVVLLHREDFYERESPRAGEIDLIVAKNRNGSLATITEAFQGHYARIADMFRNPRGGDQ